MSRQLSLFDADNKAVGAVCGLTGLIRVAMNRAAAKSPLSRAQIVERMNHIALTSGKRMTQGKAKTISLDTLEKWLNPEADVVPSLQAVDIFMRAVGDLAPLEAWLSTHDCALMTPQKAKLCVYAQNVLDGKRRAKAQRRLEEDLLQQEVQS